VSRRPDPRWGGGQGGGPAGGSTRAGPASRPSFSPTAGPRWPLQVPPVGRLHRRPAPDPSGQALQAPGEGPLLVRPRVAGALSGRPGSFSRAVSRLRWARWGPFRLGARRPGGPAHGPPPVRLLEPYHAVTYFAPRADRHTRPPAYGDSGWAISAAGRRRWGRSPGRGDRHLLQLRPGHGGRSVPDAWAFAPPPAILEPGWPPSTRRWPACWARPSRSRR